ncbi:unnamed protein product [Mytilus coruscus]|uniref:Uncharacterized protein n=1 Tax=Mytilus coruscus TaxID=42192 RepID=A0A6J8E4G8_MYTCO|nr:unnamed protein product [Mytilus coruscus]
MLIKSDRLTHDISPLRDPDQNFNLAYEGTEKSEILNKYFCSISNLDDANKDLPEFDDRCHDFLSQIIVSEQDVLDIVSTLDANKAVGPDIVSNRMLLAVRNEISKPLCLLFNKSLHDRASICPAEVELFCMHDHREAEINRLDCQKTNANSSLL